MGYRRRIAGERGTGVILPLRLIQLWKDDGLVPRKGWLNDLEKKRVVRFLDEVVGPPPMSCMLHRRVVIPGFGMVRVMGQLDKMAVMQAMSETLVPVQKPSNFSYLRRGVFCIEGPENVIVS